MLGVVSRCWSCDIFLSHCDDVRRVVGFSREGDSKISRFDPPLLGTSVFQLFLDLPIPPPPIPVKNSPEGGGAGEASPCPTVSATPLPPVGRPPPSSSPFRTRHGSDRSSGRGGENCHPATQRRKVYFLLYVSSSIQANG